MVQPLLEPQVLRSPVRPLAPRLAPEPRALPRVQPAPVPAARRRAAGALERVRLAAILAALAVTAAIGLFCLAGPARLANETFRRTRLLAMQSHERELRQDLLQQQASVDDPDYVETMAQRLGMAQASVQSAVTLP